LYGNKRGRNFTRSTRYWKSELDQMATTVLKPKSFVDIIVFAVEDNFELPTDYLDDVYDKSL
jgi:hypothetical protein